MPLFLINRSKLLESVLENEGWESCREVWSGDGDDPIDFVMWDKGSRPHLPGPETAKLRCFLPQELALIDNKKHLWTACKDHLRDLLPPTYTHPTQEIAPLLTVAGRGDDAVLSQTVFFLKKTFSAGGKDVICGTLPELLRRWRAEEKPSFWVLQQGVVPGLLAGRKWTLRSYALLLPNCSVWAYDEGLAIVHRTPYSDDCGEGFDEEAHVDHKGCDRVPLTSLPNHELIQAEVREAVRRLFTRFKGKLNAARDRSRYHLFGIDFVVPADGKPFLIEVNQFPNLSINSEKVGKGVKSDMFRDMYTLFIGPRIFGTPPAPGAWVQVGNY
ncbi:Tubulin glycylase 3B [Diplonema papillatum]|nr:Tubulin glycylase 3B [Diplonema papillatum]